MHFPRIEHSWFCCFVFVFVVFYMYKYAEFFFLNVIKIKKLHQSLNCNNTKQINDFNVFYSSFVFLYNSMYTFNNIKRIYRCNLIHIHAISKIQQQTHKEPDVEKYHGKKWEFLLPKKQKANSVPDCRLLSWRTNCGRSSSVRFLLFYFFSFDPYKNKSMIQYQIWLIMLYNIFGNKML